MAEKKLTAPQIAMAQFWRDDALEAAALIVERYANPDSVDMALDIRAMKSISLQALAQPEARDVRRETLEEAATIVEGCIDKVMDSKAIRSALRNAALEVRELAAKEKRK